MTSLVHPVLEGFTEAMRLAKSIVAVPFQAAEELARLVIKFASFEDLTPEPPKTTPTPTKRVRVVVRKVKAKKLVMTKPKSRQRA